MFPNISDFLDMDDQSDLCNSFIAISDSKSDGSFLIHHFLSLLLRQKRKVCVVGLQQSFAHYNSIALRSGLNLKSSRESGKLQFVEGLKYLGDRIIAGPVKTNIQETEFNKEWADDTIGSHSLRSLYLHLKTLMNDSEPVLIIDDLTIFLSLGIPVNEILKFVHYLKSDFVSNANGVVVLFTSGNVEAEDEDQVMLWRHMCHYSTLQLHVSGLPSGYCRDVHGKITLTTRNDLKNDKTNSLKTPRKKDIQFKITDKSVICFAIGTSSVVL